MPGVGRGVQRGGRHRRVSEPLRRAGRRTLALEPGADWTIHLDADEFVEPLDERRRFTDVLADAEALGCNAIRFRVLEFVPEPGSTFLAGATRGGC